MTGVILARALSLEEFGLYSLFFTSLMLLAGLQNALITGPLRVLGVGHPREMKPYESSCLALQICFGGTLALLSTLAFLTATSGEAVALSFAFCLFLSQIQELFRAITATRLDMAALLRMDLAVHAARLTMIVAAWQAGWLSPSLAMLIMGLSAAASLQFLASDRPVVLGRSDIATALKRNWRYGRWLLMETIAYSASTQIYIYLTALWVDASAVGGLSAIQLLFSGLNVLLFGLMNAAVPTARRCLLDNGYVAWRRSLVRTAAILVGTTACVGLVICSVPGILLAFLYGSAYVAYAPLAPIVALQFVLQACATVLNAAFRTAELPQVGVAAKAASTIATTALAYPLISEWGVEGAAFGLLVTQAVWTTVYVWYVCTGYLDRANIIRVLDVSSGLEEVSKWGR